MISEHKKAIEEISLEKSTGEVAFGSGEYDHENEYEEEEEEDEDEEDDEDDDEEEGLDSGVEYLSGPEPEEYEKIRIGGGVDGDGDTVMMNLSSNNTTPSTSTTSNTSVSAPVVTKATDYEAIALKHFRGVPDYKAVETATDVWRIDDWKGLKESKVRGPTFKCAGIEWNILLFPRGNNSTNLAIYLEPLAEKKTNPETGEEESVNPNWHVCAEFILIISNPEHPEAHYLSYSSHRFSTDETDWGFSAFYDLRMLKTPNKTKYPILEGNKLDVTAMVRVIDDHTGVLWFNFNTQAYDSKENTGFVGLNNQGATCYLNSLLQSYFSTSLFRKKVYAIPTERDIPTSSVAYALQRAFYQLQKLDLPVSTLELTRSFGWDTNDAFTQHDVQEMNRILMDKLETAMKGTPIEGCLNDIFVGKMKSYIACVNVDYESSRIEDFWDIQLNVKGMLNLEQSFKSYTETEMLEGENRYQTEGFGYQDAKKGVVFESFPPVLHLQLKRFDYDFQYDTLMKINDRHEFPDSIDLKPFLDKNSDNFDTNWTYKLHGVLVHQGSISQGHYYALIKPSNEDQWFKFDDDRVTKVTPHEVFDANFGANEIPMPKLRELPRHEVADYQLKRTTSAYMLVYIRESEIGNVLSPVTDAEIPEHIPAAINKEILAAEKERKEREEMHLYLYVKVFSSDSFQHYDAFDLGPDSINKRYYDETLYDPKAQPIILKMARTASFSDLKQQIMEKTGTTDSAIRLWAMNHRSNHTIRPDGVIDNESATVDQIYTALYNSKFDEMCIYVEEAGKELNHVISSEKTVAERLNFDEIHEQINQASLQKTNHEFADCSARGSHIIVFLKYFDGHSLRGLTHVIVPIGAKVGILSEPIKKLFGVGSETQLRMVEELFYSRLEAIDCESTFSESEFSNGDVICVEVRGSDEGNVQSYYTYLSTRVHLVVKPTKKDDEEVLKVESEAETNEESKDAGAREADHQVHDFWFSLASSYDELVEEVGSRVGVDPKYLKMFASGYNGKIALHRDSNIGSIAPKYINASTSLILEYEVLNITLEELEEMIPVKVNWLSSGIIHYATYEFLVKKSGKISDLITKLKHKVNLTDEQISNLLLYTSYNHRYLDLLRAEQDIGASNVGNPSVEIFGGMFPGIVRLLVINEKIQELDAAGNLSETDKLLQESMDYPLIPVYQYHKHPQSVHGVPFIFYLKKDEPLSQTRQRLQEVIGLGEKEFAKSKITLVGDHNKVVVLTDDLVLHDKMGDRVMLGIDQVDRTPRRASQNDKGISIR